jgi:putative DNA primase/helicase
LAGHPGLGKSQLAAFLAATVSTGGQWPLGEGKAPVGSVIMVIAEDGVAETIVPRLKVSEGDLSRIHVVNQDTARRAGRPFEFASVAELLEEEIRRLQDVRLVIIDPIAALLKSARMQRASADRLQQMAGKFGLAVVAISHLTKTTRSNAMAQVMGDLGLVASARSVFIVAPEIGTNRRLFLAAKNNLGFCGGLAYRIEPKTLADGIASSAVVWDAAPVTISADEALTPAARSGKQPARADAEDFLLVLLGAGPVSAKEVKSEASDAGISWPSVRRAVEKLGVKSRRTGGAAGKGHWYWELPGRPTEGSAPDALSLIGVVNE